MPLTEPQRASFKTEMEGILQRMGDKAKAELHDAAEFALIKAEELAMIADQPGFDQALDAARDQVILRAASNAVDVADAADAEVRGMVLGGLRMLIALT